MQYIDVILSRLIQRTENMYVKKGHTEFVPFDSFGDELIKTKLVVSLSCHGDPVLTL